MAKDFKKDDSKDRKDEMSTSNATNSRRSKSRGKSKGRPNGSTGYQKTKGSNDITWHSPDMALLDRTANLSWSYQTGELINMDRAIGSDHVTQDDESKMGAQAGLFVIREQLSVGGAGYYLPGNAANLHDNPAYFAANSLLTTMRSRTRVRNTYDAPDVFMLMLAMDNIYAGIAFAKRLAATVNMYSYQNHYMPRLMIEAQGMDFDWFVKHSYEFVTQLNVLISEVNKVYIPNRMHLFELHSQRFSNYYTEGKTIRDQIYMFTPGFLNIIDYNAGEDYASMIRPYMIFPGTNVIGNQGEIHQRSFSEDWLTTGETLLVGLRAMIHAVVNHDSTADITGDMENAFGAEARFICSPCDPNAIALPVFDYEILETIHNSFSSTIVTNNFTAYSYADNPDTVPPVAFSTIQRASDNRIGTYDCYGVGTNDSWRNLAHSEASFRVLDVHEDPNPQKTFAITRCRNVVADVNEANDYIYQRIEMGADLILRYEVWDFALNTQGKRISRKQRVRNLPIQNIEQMETVVAASPFHYKPIAYLLTTDYKTAYNRWFLGETDIYSEIPDIEFIRNMNRLSLLSLLGADRKSVV